MLIRNLDIKNFELLFKSNYKQLFVVSYRITKNKSASEDIIQELFLYLWETKKFKTDKLTFENYLFKSIYNRSLNYLRDSAKHDNNFDLAEASEVYTKDKLSDLDYELLETSIFQSIENLPPKCRVIFVMSRIEGKQHKEIAEILDVSTKTVENQISIALRKINTSISPEIKVLFDGVTPLVILILIN